MLALSIRQPWATLILHAGKDIENRSWPTKVRGRVLVHASNGVTRQEYEDATDFAMFRCKVSGELLDGACAFDGLHRGGIVGSVEIVDCVQASASPWFMGKYGFVLRDPQPLPFVPRKGALGFFDVPGCWDAP